MSFTNKRIVLASRSPRRSELLKAAGFEFEIRTADVDESFPADMPVAQVATFLAEKKAAANTHFLNREDEILLTADSTVVMGEEIFNKPENTDHARQMLQKLSGNQHTVYTGICLQSQKKKQTRTGISQVWIEPLSDREINYYIEHYQPFDKAGSYAIQEWIGLCKISKIEGTYSNIMGLPVNLVYDAIINWDAP